MDITSSTENITTPSHDLHAEIARLTQASNDEVERIRNAATLHQQELMKQLDWSKEEEQANIEVAKIRLERDIERLVRQGSGELLTEGPICRLPVEILSYIFRSYVDCDMSPWRLVKVCKSWMQIALATPRLWRHICVTPKPLYSSRETWVVDGEKRISEGRLQICNTPVQLQAALRRSGVVPLEIKLDFTNTKGGNPISLLFPLFRSILNDPISQRVEILTMVNLWIPDQPDVSIGGFPLLREMLLPSRLDSWTYSLLESVGLTATRFDTLRLTCEISPELAKYSFWPLLKTLGLTVLGRFNEIADKLVKLEELPICPGPWPDDDTPLVTWEKIRCTSIRCHPCHLDRIVLPNLDSLIFRDMRYLWTPEATMDVYSPISFPKLTKLETFTPDPRWLAKAYLPLLIDLNLSCDTSEDGFPDGGILLNTSTFPALEALSLTTRWADSLLVEIIASLPNLTTISFSSSRYKDQEFGLVLLDRLDRRQPLLCPNLLSISLGSQGRPVRALKKNASPLLKRLVTSRKKIGKPLGKLCVCWAKSSYTVENYV